MADSGDTGETNTLVNSISWLKRCCCEQFLQFTVRPTISLRCDFPRLRKCLPCRQSCWLLHWAMATGVSLVSLNKTWMTSWINNNQECFLVNILHFGSSREDFYFWVVLNLMTLFCVRFKFVDVNCLIHIEVLHGNLHESYIYVLIIVKNNFLLRKKSQL